jgi:hypothetical protein
MIMDGSGEGIMVGAWKSVFDVCVSCCLVFLQVLERA